MVTPPYPSLPTLDDLLSVQGLQHLSLFAKHAVQGPLAGYHRSPLKGFSVEFAEHRAYTPGDSLRRLDWKRLAKTDKMLIKTTDAETNLSCTVVLDRSGSMRAEHKLAFTALAVALIGEALGSQRDAIGLTLLNDDRGETVFECKTSVAHRMALYERVLSTVRESLPPTSERTRISPVLHRLAESLPSRSMVVVFSDFWEHEPDSEEGGLALQKALEHLRQKNCWVLLFPVFGRAEQTLTGLDSEDRWTEMVDSETGEKILVLPKEVQKNYASAFESRLHDLKNLQQPPQIQIHTCSTDDHPLHALLPFFLAHQKMK